MWTIQTWKKEKACNFSDMHIEGNNRRELHYFSYLLFENLGHIASVYVQKAVPVFYDLTIVTAYCNFIPHSPFAKFKLTLLFAAIF